MEDLVRVRVADTAEQTRIGEGALERVILGEQPLRERRTSGGERLQSASIEFGEPARPGPGGSRRVACSPLP